MADIAPRDDPPQRAAAEVLELGQALFDVALDLVAGEEPLEADEIAATVDEMRATSEVFFEALRLLLGLAQDSAEAPKSPMAS